MIPITGKDAVRLWNQLEENQYKKANTEELKRIRGNAAELKAIQKFEPQKESNMKTAHQIAWYPDIFLNLGAPFCRKLEEDIKAYAEQAAKQALQGAANSFQRDGNTIMSTKIICDAVQQIILRTEIKLP